MLSLHGVSHDAWDRYTDRGDWHYDVLAHGFKYNLSDIQAALGIHQLRKLDQFIERRALYARMYHRRIRRPGRGGDCRPTIPAAVMRGTSTFSGSICAGSRSTAAKFIRELQQRGIGTSVHFIPIPLLRFFARLPLAQYACPRALDLYPRIVSLPLYPAMTEEQVHYVAQSVREILESSRRVRFVAPGAPTATFPPAHCDAAGSSERCL